MIISGDTVVFRSADEWYEIERAGLKPNTLRLMTHAEFRDLVDAAPSLIVIRSIDGDRCFTRQIMSIYNVTGVLGDAPTDKLPTAGHVLVEICWRHVLTLGERSR